MKQIEAGLRQQRVRERRAEFVKELRDKAGVKVLLEPPRVAVDAGRATRPRGRPTAPVTIVEFSDFQCPFCSRVNPTLKQVEETYGDKVRIVFRDFPLLQIHPGRGQGRRGGALRRTTRASSGRCTTSCSPTSPSSQVDGPEAVAPPSSASTPTTFDQCLDSGKHAAEWQKDVEEGARYGVTGTPAFFINGRLLAGAQPLRGLHRRSSTRSWPGCRRRRRAGHEVAPRPFVRAALALVALSASAACTPR